MAGIAMRGAAWALALRYATSQHIPPNLEAPTSSSSTAPLIPAQHPVYHRTLNPTPSTSPTPHQKHQVLDYKLHEHAARRAFVLGHHGTGDSPAAAAGGGK